MESGGRLICCCGRSCSFLLGVRDMIRLKVTLPVETQYSVVRAATAQKMARAMLAFELLALCLL